MFFKHTPKKYLVCACFFQRFSVILRKIYKKYIKNMIYLGLYILFGLLCFVILLMVEHILALKKFKTENPDMSYNDWIEKGNFNVSYGLICYLSIFWIVNLCMLAVLAVDYMITCAVSAVTVAYNWTVKRITGRK